MVRPSKKDSINTTKLELKGETGDDINHEVILNTFLPAFNLSY